MSWHDQPFSEALTRFGTRVEQGLDENGARQRLARYGPNRLPEPKRAGPLARFARQFHNVLIYVLMAAGTPEPWSRQRLGCALAAIAGCALGPEAVLRLLVLFVVVHVNPHRVSGRSGDDLTISVPVKLDWIETVCDDNSVTRLSSLLAKVSSVPKSSVIAAMAAARIITRPPSGSRWSRGLRGPARDRRQSADQPLKPARPAASATGRRAGFGPCGLQTAHRSHHRP